jgi:hypothetical protein
MGHAHAFRSQSVTSSLVVSVAFANPTEGMHQQQSHGLFLFLFIHSIVLMMSVFLVGWRSPEARVISTALSVGIDGRILSLKSPSLRFRSFALIFAP